MKPSTWQDSTPQTLDCQPGALTAVLQRMPMKKKHICIDRVTRKNGEFMACTKPGDNSGDRLDPPSGGQRKVIKFFLTSEGLLVQKKDFRRWVLSSLLKWTIEGNTENVI